jgi:Protein of unknown function (DUF3108)
MIMKRFAIYTSATLLLIGGISFKNKFQAPAIEMATPELNLPTVKNTAFKRGEKLTFRLHYGLVEAGKVTLNITDENLKFGQRNTLHVVGLGTSQGVSDWFFKVRDRYETYIDEDAIVPWMFIRRVDEGGYKFQQDYVFNHYQNKVKTDTNKSFDITPNMQDMISAFYRGRTLDFSQAKVGSVYNIDCFLDEEIFPVKIKFIGRETVKIKLGSFKCLKFRPLVQKGRVFKHEEDLNIWISDDGNHIPIKGKADILFGSVQIELTDYAGLANPISKVK